MNTDEVPLLILAVDDEPNILRMLGRTMRKLGCEVQTAGSAEEALEVLEGGGAPDAIIADRMMAGMSGTELLQRVARRTPAALRVLCSGATDEFGPVPEVQAGLAHTVLGKPFFLEDVRNLIDAIRRHRAAR